MKPAITALLLVPALTIAMTSAGQISGNRVYNNDGGYYRNNNGTNGDARKPVIVRDSIMLVSANILLNIKADSLVVTLALAQEAKTLRECNVLLDKRLGAFTAALKGTGIGEKDRYTDFISQTKVYGYTQTGNTFNQILKGFEIRKNIIIKINASSMLEKVIALASEQEIYDIVKVDYINTNIQKIYADMMKAASGIVHQKKDVYLMLSPVTLLPVPEIVSERFFAVYPGTQYKQYEAFETSEVGGDYSSVRNYARKNKTFYYDKIDQSEFDLVINNASPVVGIQYILQIQMQFDIKRK